MAYLTYKFDDLPLITTPDGIKAGLVCGKAEIWFSSEGEWNVTHDLFLDGIKDGVWHDVEVLGGSDLWWKIQWELSEGSFKDSIAEAVREALEEEGIVPRSDYAEHSTLHREYQGG